MPKIDINQVAEILKRNQIEPAILRRIVEEMNQLVEPDAAEENKPPPVKKQWLLLVSDPEARLPKHDFVGWVVQIPADASPATTQDRIFRAVYEFNTTKRGRQVPVKTVGEALESVPAKHFKEAELWVKTKEPVFLLRTDNQIPQE